MHKAESQAAGLFRGSSILAKSQRSEILAHRRFGRLKAQTDVPLAEVYIGPLPSRPIGNVQDRSQTLLRRKQANLRTLGAATIIVSFGKSPQLSKFS